MQAKITAYTGQITIQICMSLEIIVGIFLNGIKMYLSNTYRV